jgi:hypothetical protein
MNKLRKGILVQGHGGRRDRGPQALLLTGGLRVSGHLPRLYG